MVTEIAKSSQSRMFEILYDPIFTNYWFCGVLLLFFGGFLNTIFEYSIAISPYFPVCSVGRSAQGALGSCFLCRVVLDGGSKEVTKFHLAISRAFLNTE